jgi:phosphotransferase system HPr (HPr) family protein
MLRKEVIVRDFHGLRLKPAAKIARACRGIDSKVTVCKGSEIADASSIDELLRLDAERGSALEIVADGNEEEIAMQRIIGLF